MSRTWYGSISNRLEENRMFTDEINVGTGMTEYLYSDRHPFEVTAVKDQKHLTVRALDHRHVGENHMDNNWELLSNPDNPELQICKRGKYWYWVSIVNAAVLDDATPETMIWLALHGIDPDLLREKGELKKYTRANVSFGTAEYHYDYEF